MATKAKAKGQQKKDGPAYAKMGDNGGFVDKNGESLDNNQVCWNCTKIIPPEGDWSAWGLCDDPECLEAVIPYWACKCKTYYFRATIEADCQECGSKRPTETRLMRMREIIVLNRLWDEQSRKYWENTEVPKCKCGLPKDHKKSCLPRL